jgi:glycosyltransferase involved in cell wall biosynthesis
MKILQTISSLGASSGGPSTCTRDLMEELWTLNAGVNLVTAQSYDNLGVGSPWMIEFPNDYRTPLGLSKNLKNFLAESEYDLYHANGLWMYQCHATCLTARAKGKPYIISPHGMLYPTALKIKRWKKIPMLKLWFNKDIHGAACLHATCKEEMEHCRAFGYKGPVAVIPNPVVLPKGVKAATKKPMEKCIGFLGRLHPIKKIENLLRGAALALDKGCPAFTIEIMGKGSDEYEKFLQDEAVRLGLKNVVNFVGFVMGQEKYDRLTRLHALMVPSEQENFGMIVPEALICGTPVYASLGTPWQELETEQCGWWRDNSPESIAEVIMDVMSRSNDEILHMGARGRILVENKYEQIKVATMMKQLYEWIINEGERPEFVYI